MGLTRIFSWEPLLQPYRSVAGNQGALLGALARPSSIAMAIAPGLVAAGLSSGFSMHAGIGVLTLVSALALVCFWFVTRL
jgi:hypothetical protein